MSLVGIFICEPGKNVRGEVMGEYSVVYEAGKEVMPSLSEEVMSRIAKGETVTLAVSDSQAYTVSNNNGRLKVVCQTGNNKKVWVSR